MKLTLSKVVANVPFELYVRAQSENENTTLMYYKGKLSKKLTIPLVITFGNDTNSVKIISIEFDLSSTKLEHQQLLLGQDTKNLSSKYQVSKNNIITIISIIGSVIIAIVATVIIVQKRKKLKN